MYKGFDMPDAAEYIAKELIENADLVINFARPERLITERLRRGKMIVDWLKEWQDVEERVAKG